MIPSGPLWIVAGVWAGIGLVLLVVGVRALVKGVPS